MWTKMLTLDQIYWIFTFKQRMVIYCTDKGTNYCIVWNRNILVDYPKLWKIVFTSTM